MAKKIRVAVIFGGRSGEHEVSIRSARSVIAALDRREYEVIPIGIDKEGRWLPAFESLKLLPADLSVKFSNNHDSHHEAVAILGDPSQRGITILSERGKEASSKPIDVVFPVLHGTYGEDGTIQGLLELAGIPYVGCGVLGSSTGMDKVTMKALFHEAGLPICAYTWFLRSEWEKNKVKVGRQVAKKAGFPCFVKPANLGSSVGISKATDVASLQKSIELAARYDRRIIVEEGLNAREIECAIMGNDEPQASMPGEYVLKDERAAFLDYTEKYANTGHVEFQVPAPLSKSLTAKIQKMAIKAFQVIDGAGLSRVDFFLTRDTNTLYVNEINTMPGLTDVSGYPKMWAGTGLTFPSVIDQLIQLAFQRADEKARNLTTR